MILLEVSFLIKKLLISIEEIKLLLSSNRITSCPVCSTNMTACSGKEAEPEPEEPTEQSQEKSNTGGLVLFLVVALLGGGGAFYYFKFMKPKQSVKGGTDLEDFDFEDYDEDEPEPDDADGDASEDDTEDEDA